MAILKGKWIFNEVLTFPDKLVSSGYHVPEGAEPWEYYRFFGSNNQEFHILYCYPEDENLAVMYGDGVKWPYGTDGNWGWIEKEDRIVDFFVDKEVDDEFYQWFTANAKPLIQKLYTEYYIQDIADAIREKTGTTSTFTVEEMAEAIRSI